MTKKTNFASWSIQNRMSDADYIKHLEAQIETIDERVEKFIELMDKAVFSRDNLEVLKTYADNASMLRF